MGEYRLNQYLYMTYTHGCLQGHSGIRNYSIICAEGLDLSWWDCFRRFWKFYQVSLADGHGILGSCVLGVYSWKLCLILGPFSPSLLSLLFSHHDVCELLCSFMPCPLRWIETSETVSSNAFSHSCFWEVHCHRNEVSDKHRTLVQQWCLCCDLN